VLILKKLPMMVWKMTEILRGDVWLFNPEPTIGREIGKKLRPAIVLSNDTFNNGPSGLVIIVPLTTKDKKIPCHILISVKDGGVKESCYAVCEQIRSISKERLISKWGHMRNSDVLRQMSEWLAALLSIDEY
jgi:mRNA interferase MazF